MSFAWPINGVGATYSETIFYICLCKALICCGSVIVENFFWLELMVKLMNLNLTFKLALYSSILVYNPFKGSTKSFRAKNTSLLPQHTFLLNVHYMAPCPPFITEVFCLVSTVQLLNIFYSEISMLYNLTLALLGRFLMVIPRQLPYNYVSLSTWYVYNCYGMHLELV